MFGRIELRVLILDFFVDLPTSSESDDTDGSINSLTLASDGGMATP